MNPTDQMSRLLASSSIPLSDPNAVAQELLNARFTAREIEKHQADAIETARGLRVSRNVMAFLAEIGGTT